MKIDEMFPRKYANGADLGGKPVSLTIDTVRHEQMCSRPGAVPEKKYVVYFVQAEKGVVLSRTLAHQIDNAVDGEGETDNWKDERVTLYPVPMKVAGKDRIAIRAREATNGKQDTPEAMQDD